MGEKGNAVSVGLDEGSSFIAGAAGTVVSTSQEIGESIKARVVDTVAEQVIDEARERMRKPGAEGQDGSEAEGPQ